MRIAFIVFNGMTLLDFIGFYDPVTRLKTMGFMTDLTWDVCAITSTVKDIAGLQIIPSKVKPNLSEYDIVFVPGGLATRELMNNDEFIEWIKTAKSCSLKVSVCTGSLLLGAAGFLKEKIATTHPNAFSELKRFCKKVVDKRIVDEGDVITAGGVTSSIDLGLYICNKFAGYDVMKKIQKQMDYKGNIDEYISHHK